MLLQLSTISTPTRTFNIEGSPNDVNVVERLVLFLNGFKIKEHVFLFDFNNPEYSEHVLKMIEKIWKQVFSILPSVFYISCSSCVLPLITYSIEERYIVFLARAMVNDNITIFSSESELVIKDNESGINCFNTIYAATANLGILDRD